MEKEDIDGAFEMIGSEDVSENNDIDNPAATIVIKYGVDDGLDGVDGVDGGDFTIVSDIGNHGKESALIMGRLLFFMSQGGIEAYVYKSLENWSGSEDEKNEFNRLSLIEFKRLYDLNKEAGEDVSEEVAVKAGDVFNFKGGNE